MIVGVQKMPKDGTAKVLACLSTESVNEYVTTRNQYKGTGMRQRKFAHLAAHICEADAVPLCAKAREIASRMRDWENFAARTLVASDRSLDEGTC